MQMTDHDRDKIRQNVAKVISRVYGTDCFAVVNHRIETARLAGDTKEVDRLEDVFGYLDPYACHATLPWWR